MTDFNNPNDSGNDSNSGSSRDSASSTSDEPKKVSTSRLAKLANVDSRQLFNRLLQRQWITRQSVAGKSQYQLTAKGEFEGGEYQTSEKFGTYIVWPTSLLQHRLLSELEQPQLTATAIGKQINAPARMINLLLADIGWLQPVASGWQISPEGARHGGTEKETADAARYVVWPHDVVQQSPLNGWLQQLCDRNSELLVALDGRPVRDAGERLITNWLYLNRLHFCTQRLLSDDWCADFLLPDARLVIQYWGADKSPAALQKRLQAPTLAQAADYQLIEVTAQDCSGMDKTLTRELQRAGVRLPGAR